MKVNTKKRCLNISEPIPIDNGICSFKYYWLNSQVPTKEKFNLLSEKGDSTDAELLSNIDQIAVIRKSTPIYVYRIQNIKPLI